MIRDQVENSPLRSWWVQTKVLLFSSTPAPHPALPDFLTQPMAIILPATQPKQPWALDSPETSSQSTSKPSEFAQFCHLCRYCPGPGQQQSLPAGLPSLPHSQPSCPHTLAPRREPALHTALRTASLKHRSPECPSKMTDNTVPLCFRCIPLYHAIHNFFNG